MSRAILERIEALLHGEVTDEYDLIREYLGTLADEELMELVNARVAYLRGDGPRPRPLIDMIRPAQRHGPYQYLAHLSDEELLERLAEKRKKVRQQKAEREARGRHGAS